MSDLIDRQAAIDICANAIDLWHGQLGEGALVAVRDMISELPSAQPEKRTGERTETHACDSISRQAAIDAIDEISNEVADGDGFDYAKWREYFCDLPSAQPDIIRCKDCKYAEYIDDVRTLWCTECGQGRTVAPNDFCSYGKR